MGQISLDVTVLNNGPTSGLKYCALVRQRYLLNPGFFPRKRWRYRYVQQCQLYLRTSPGEDGLKMYLYAHFMDQSLETNNSD